VNSIAFNVPPPTDWTPPGGPPQPAAAQALVEAPHFGAGDDLRYALSLVARAGSFDMSYEAWADMTGGTTYTKKNDVRDFSPTGVLTTALAVNGVDTGASFTVGTGIDFAYIDAGTAADRDDGKNLVLIGNEWLAWQTMVDNGNGTRTFNGAYRAVLDTVPEAHAIGDRVWFVTEGAGLVSPDGLGVDATIRAKMLTKGIGGTLPIASAVAMTLTTASRSVKPIVPGKVRVNATRPYDLVGTVTGSFTVAWAHRNRTLGTILSQSAASVPPEDGTTYNLYFYNNATSALIVSKLGMSGEGASVGLAFNGVVRMELESQRNGLKSFKKQVFTFTVAAGGVTTSVITADAATYVLDGGAP
jgi:hypothetical protein